MINILIYLITLIIVIFYSSCCTKKGCKDGSIIEEIRFVGFESSEFDTLLVKSFSKNSNFSTPIDSFYSYNFDYYGVHLPRPLDIQYDWEITLICDMSSYKLTDFVVKKEVCNWCLWVLNDYYNKLETYKVNGTTMTDNIVKIIK